MADKIKLRRDTLANWKAVNPILDEGEIGVITDRNTAKIGDGTHGFNDLQNIHGVPEGWANVKDFGAKGDGLTNDSPSINEALQAVKTVFIPEGNYLIGNSINIPSNRTLLIDGNATLKLADNANCYIIKNEDFINGNENIYIIGLGKKPTINGNAVNQSRNYLNGAIDGYFGMGLFFNKVNNLNIYNLYIYETNSWGIAYWSVNEAVFKNITFNQTINYGYNGDGITGSGSNIHIENIDGFTNDDMIAVAAGGGTVQGNDMLLPIENVENVTIKNVYAKDRDGNPIHRPIALYGEAPDEFSTTTMKNVLIENINGSSHVDSIYITNYWQNIPETFELENITFKNINCSPSDASTLTYRAFKFRYAKIKDIHLQNMSINKNIRFENTIVNDLFIDSVYFENYTNIYETLIYDLNSIDNIFASNIKIKDMNPSLTNDSIFYHKNSTADNKTNIYFSNVSVEKSSPNHQSIIKKTSGLIRAIGISDVVDKNYLTPDLGDTILDISGQLLTWNGTAWV